MRTPGDVHANTQWFTFELVKDLAKGFVKKQIEDKTGIKL
jgi:hypothetical protein